jgi:phage tail-like protein
MAEYNYVPAFSFTLSFMGNLPKEFEHTDQVFRFQDVSGLKLEMKTENVEEGGVNNYVHKLPQRAEYGPLVLKRALGAAPSLISKWAEEAIIHFNFYLLDVVVSMCKLVPGDKMKKEGDRLEPVKTWVFYGAYPTKLELSPLNANENKLVIETLELAYRYVMPVYKK